MRSCDLELRPSHGVVVHADCWERAGWGVSVPVPPSRIDDSSTDGEIAAAEFAVAYGMASVRRVVRSRSRGQLKVFPAEAVVMTASFTLFVIRATVAFASIHRLPLGALGAALVISIAGGWPPAITGIELLLALVASILLHELGHAVAFALVRKRSEQAVLVINRRVAWLVRPAGTRVRELGVTIAGPAAPALLAILSCPLFFEDPSLVVGLAVIGMGHVVCLALPAGDGAILRGACTH